ncbi:hypothetical protein C0J52_23041 [Blattella germanica]|nr:hypothetical protein C0J52_23041 [Blattella germanica]
MVRGMRGGMKSLFNDTSIDTPASPPPMAMDESCGVPLLNTDPEPEPEPDVSEGKPIEVISSRTKSEEQFNITEFLKSLIPTGASPSIPGLNMDPPPQDALSPSVSKSLYNSPPNINPPLAYDYPEDPTPTPLQPPPLPPNLFPLEDTSYKYDPPVEREEDAWNTKLPPKFPTWGDTAPGWEREEPDKTSEWTPVLPPNKVVPTMPPISLDTPESPPLYEKEGFSDPVEYDDSIVEPPLMSSSGDVDHRTLVHLPVNNHTKDTDQRVIPPVTPTNHSKKDMDHRPMLSRKKDVDHRNLISLTGSPVREHSILPPPPTPPTLNWSHSDQDYRTNIPPPPLPIKKELIHQGDQDYRLHPPHLGRRQLDESQDNVESVDMEMSDDEMAESVAMDDMPHMLHEKKSMMDKDRDYDMCNKPVISFNINSNSKVLTHSPLNEVKDDMSRSRNRVHGCQKIPTISGIGGNMHPPRGMGPLRPRIPILTPPPGIKRLPPPGLPRGFRPSMMTTPPPPLPPFPPHILQPPPERFNVTIEIKPNAEIESQRKAEELAARKELQARKETQTIPLLPPPPPPEIPKIIPKLEKETKPQVNDRKDWIKEIVPPKTPTEVKVNSSIVTNVKNENIKTEKIENNSTVQENEVGGGVKIKKEEGDVKNKEEKGGEEPMEEGEKETDEKVQTVVSAEIVPKSESVKQIINPFDIPGSEHWMNNELAELEQMEMASSMDTTNNSVMDNALTNTMGSPTGKIMGRGQGGRGRPFKNFQRGGFMPRTRPMWNGPRRGGPPRPPPPPPPPGRFPFRPPLERPFGRGHRGGGERGGGGGGFRPFRGNRGHFGGW